MEVNKIFEETDKEVIIEVYDDKIVYRYMEEHKTKNRSSYIKKDQVKRLTREIRHIVSKFEFLEYCIFYFFNSNNEDEYITLFEWDKNEQGKYYSPEKDIEIPEDWIQVYKKVFSKNDRVLDILITLTKEYEGKVKLSIYKDCKKSTEAYFNDGYLDRDFGRPTIINYLDQGYVEEYYKKGELTKESGLLK